MSLPIRSEQRLVITVVALIFGPLFMLGPVAGGLLLLILGPFSAVTVLVASLLTCVSAFLIFQMTQNYQWVEFDGTNIVGRRFWTRRLVANTLADVREVRVLGGVKGQVVTSVIDATLGPVRGYEICFHHGPSIAVIRVDMKNAEELAHAVERALQQRGT